MGWSRCQRWKTRIDAVGVKVEVEVEVVLVIGIRGSVGRDWRMVEAVGDGDADAAFGHRLGMSNKFRLELGHKDRGRGTRDRDNSEGRGTMM